MSKEEDPDSSSSDSSDSSSDEEEVSIDLGEVDRLEMQLRSQPYNFAFHEQYISALGKAGKVKAGELRAAREDISKKFPLPEGIWLHWTKDEAQAANTAEEKEKVIQLYETALQDYQSVPLRVSYGAFVETIAFANSKGGMPDAASTKKVRDVYEAGLTSVGLHMSEGHRLWAAYRTFEQRILSFLGKTDAEKNKQIERIRSLYKRQLTVPHKNMEETYADFVSFEASLDPPGPNPDTVGPFQTQYKNALAAVEARSNFEESVAGPVKPSDPDYTKVPAWREYLEFEELKGDPARIQCLYERALKGYFLVVDLWTLYIAFLEKTFAKLPQVTFPIYARAVRNCYWSGDLWVSHLRSLEQAQRPVAEIEGAFETGLVSGLQQENDFMIFWDAFVDYHRRRYTSSPNQELAEQLRATMQRQIDYFLQYFPDSPVKTKIQRHFARIEANVLKNIINARKHYSELIHHDNTDYHTWCEWIASERAHAQDDHARQLHRRAAQIAALSDPLRARADWISFEREVGDLDKYRTAVAQCAVYDAEMYARSQAQAQAQAQAPTQQAQPQEKRRGARDVPDRSKRRQADDRYDAGAARSKRPRSDEDPNRQYPRRGEENGSGASKEHTDQPMPGGEHARIERGGRGDKRGDTRGDTRHRKEDEDFTPQPAAANNIIHISNLPWKMHEPEIEEFFNKIGKIKTIRLVKNQQNNKSMGYAFVEFENEKDAAGALELNDTEVQNRKVRVQLSTNAMPHPSRSYLRAPTAASSEQPDVDLSGHNEDLTLFVSNLPFSCNQDDVIKALAPVREAIRDVRLAMDSKEGGRCRGFGYIEFADSEGVAKALAITNPSVKGRSVNITSARDKHTKSGNKSGVTTGETTPADGAEGEEKKPQVRRGMAVPRALKLKVVTTSPAGNKGGRREATEKKEQGEPEKKGGGDVEMGEAAKEEAPKTNDFFKNLMKKK